VKYCPAAQGVTPDAHNAASPTESSPDSQATHFEAPPAENCPAEHAEHTSTLSLEYMPATQSTQMNEFVAYVPYCPAAHVVPPDMHDGAPEAELLPDSQGVHSATPAIENSPAAHAEHSFEFKLEYIPAAQSVHVMGFKSFGTTIVPYFPATQRTVSVWAHEAEPGLVDVEQGAQEALPAVDE
jgi:hypothetical protein